MSAALQLMQASPLTTLPSCVLYIVAEGTALNTATRNWLCDQQCAVYKNHQSNARGGGRNQHLSHVYTFIYSHSLSPLYLSLFLSISPSQSLSAGTYVLWRRQYNPETSPVQRWKVIFVFTLRLSVTIYNSLAH